MGAFSQICKWLLKFFFLVLWQSKDTDLKGFTMKILMTAGLIIKPDPSEMEYL